jgi:hypothetical protein
MEIKIEKPFRLHLVVVETDEHISSMKVHVTVDVQQFGHKLEYRGSFWLDCNVWDTFVTDLGNIDSTEANLVDMSSHFALKLGTVAGKPEIAWEMKKTDVIGGATAASFRSPIDGDTLQHVAEQFAKFDRWW